MCISIRCLWSTGLVSLLLALSACGGGTGEAASSAVLSSSNSSQPATSSSISNSSVVTVSSIRSGISSVSSSVISSANSSSLPATPSSSAVSSSSSQMSRSAIMSAGSSFSSISSSLAEDPDDVSPGIPTGFHASHITADSVSLAWDEAVDDVAIAGYELSRDGVVIGHTSGAQTTYLDAGRAAATVYTYAVRSVDTSENKSAYSPPLEITTLAAINACIPAIAPVADTLTLRAKGTTCADLGFAEYVPADYANKNDWPVIISLNGNGQTGTGSAADIQKIDDDGLPKEVKNGTWDPDKRFVVLAPQMNWQTRTADHLHEFIQFAKANYRIDTKRIYLTALSGGGGPFYQYLENYSGGEIAAAVPIATLFDFSSTPCKWKHVPFWLFFGANDDVAQVNSHATRPYNDLKNCNPASPVLPRFTEYVGVGHDSWTRTYNLTGLNTAVAAQRDIYDMSIYDWLLGHYRGIAGSSSSSSSTSSVLSSSSVSSSSDSAGNVSSVSSSVSLASSSNSSQISSGDKLDPEFGQLTLIDSFHAASPGSRPVLSQPDGAGAIQTILGRSALVLAPQNTAGNMRASYAAFRIGEGRGLIPGNAYVLEFDYPDDVPRTMVFLNRGADLVRTVATGKEIGDYREQYAYPNPESLAYPHTGQWQTYRFYFYLHDRFQPLAGVRNEADTKRPFGPQDGFWVAVGHYNPKGNPLSQGAAVGEIRLYEVANPASAKLAVNYPPDGIPHRRTFWREEMGDGPSTCQRGDSVVRTDPSVASYSSAGACNPATGTSPGTTTRTWIEYKMRLSQVLGFNVFTKDLLEFGHNQGMDLGSYGGAAFFVGARDASWPYLTQRAANYNLEVLPYFEYAGGKGNGEFTATQCPGVSTAGHAFCSSAFGAGYQCKTPWDNSAPKCFLPSYGYQKPCEPLTRSEKRYTAIGWAEDACIDVSDPAALVDVKKLMAANLLDLRANANFAGAWFRTRIGSWPISFTAETRARYAADRNRVVPSKAELRTDSALRADYHSWWFDKRRAYLLAIRDYLRAGKNGNNGIADANVLFTSYHEEGLPIPAPNYADTRVVTDDISIWNTINTDARWQWRYSPISPSQWLSDKRYATTLSALPLPELEQLAGLGAYDEWGHGTPPADPEKYQQGEGVLLTMPYARQYTVADTALLQKFTTQEGLALIRHFPLNEDDGNGTFSNTNAWPMSGYFGYFVSDVERSTPYTMLTEVRALAESDPYWIGYLSSNSFNTGAPQDLRRFNAAYLAWPALPSVKVATAATASGVVVRDMVTQQGKFVAVFNTGMTPLANVQINISATRMGAASSVRDRVSGQNLAVSGGKITLNLAIADFRVFYVAN